MLKPFDTSVKFGFQKISKQSAKQNKSQNNENFYLVLLLLVVILYFKVYLNLPGLCMYGLQRTIPEYGCANLKSSFYLEICHFIIHRRLTRTMSRVKSNASAEIAKCDVLVVPIEASGHLITAREFLDLIEMLIENDQRAI